MTDAQWHAVDESIQRALIAFLFTDSPEEYLMGVIAKEPESDYELPPAGTHTARCYRVVDLGTQYDEMYNETKRKVMLSWEIDKLMSDGQPFTAAKFYTLSLHEDSHLRKDLENWRSRQFTEDERKGFDISKVVGSYCLLSITHKNNTKGKPRAQVTALMALPGGITRPQPVNKNVVFSLDGFDSTVFEGLSEGLQRMIQASSEYQQRFGAAHSASGKPRTDEDFNDDIPF